MAVTQGGSPLASFAYDGNGRRATKTASGTTTSYVYDGAQFLEERPGAGTPKRYVYGLGIDRVLAQSVGSATSYFVADHLGSIVQVTDSLGATTLTREYDPWGNALQGSTTGGYAFTGREWEPETDLYYYRARYYDPRQARFLSEDPARIGNLYRYALGSPIMWTDPLGLDVFLRTEGISGGRDALFSGHASVIVPDPNSPTGYTEYSYLPVYGGYEAPLMTIGSPGRMQRSFPPSTAGTLRVCASESGDAAARAEAERLSANPGRYNPYTNSCAGVARDLLIKANSKVPAGPIFNPDSPLWLKEDVQTCQKRGEC